MSKPVKNLITKAYTEKFGASSGAVLIGMRGTPSNDNNKFRAALAARNVRATVVKNSLARKSFTGTPLAPLCDMMTGPTALVYGGETVVDVARALIDIVKDFKTIELKGAVMEGMVFGTAEIDRLSKFPTRIEALGNLAGQAMGPARKLASAVRGPGGRVAGILKAIQEKLEKGETIAKVG